MAGMYAPDAPGESGLIRVLAPNPSPMTAEGTNSYVLGTSDLAVIDPGPDLPAHLDALVAAIGGRPVRAILVTHAHLDHSPAAHPLARRVGAPVLAFGSLPAPPDDRPDIGGGEGVDRAFRPDRTLAAGDTVTGTGWTLRALHTPGHMPDHLSFHWVETRATFTGDTVMGWASTMISPPDGDLDAFYASLDALERLDASRFYPGHGAPVDAPAARCRALRAHRDDRTRAILTALVAAPTIPELVHLIYADTPQTLHGAASRNVLAHLLHLAKAGRVGADPAPGPQARWYLI
ncbi:MAG: MBL fold metallo-hydrolase [Pseudomonadota bacterium]